MSLDLSKYGGLPDVFWEYVCIGSPNECWPWVGNLDRSGYGIFHIGKGTFRASRLVLKSKMGSIPRGIHALHTCDFPSCCNPEHIFPGTNWDNVLDCVKKGRTERHPGISNGRSKLSDDIVVKLRHSYANAPKNSRGYVARGFMAALCKEYGMSGVSLLAAIRGETWSHIKEGL